MDIAVMFSNSGNGLICIHFVKNLWSSNFVLQGYQYTTNDRDDRSEPIIPMHGFMEIQNTPHHPKYSKRADSQEPWLEKGGRLLVGERQHPSREAYGHQRIVNVGGETETKLSVDNVACEDEKACRQLENPP